MMRMSVKVFGGRLPGVAGLSLFVILIAACAGRAAAGSSTMPAQVDVYVGTYTGPTGGKGIYRYHLDLANGKLEGGELAAEAAKPSFLAIHPNGKFLYAVGELGEFRGRKTGFVSAYAVGPKGDLALLNQQSSGGTGPCHVIVDSEAKNVIVANYSGGSVAVLPIKPDGSLAEPTCVIAHRAPADDAMLAGKARVSHCHSSLMDASGKWALVADLGLDRVFCYRLDAGRGILGDAAALSAATSVRLADGAGPRHMAWGAALRPSGDNAARVLYVLNELNSTISTMEFDAVKGAITPVQTLTTLPAGFAGKNSCAEVRVHPSGRFVYASNRGHDSIAIFSVEQGTGRLKALGHEPTGGRTPRNFAIEPGGRFLLAANQGSGNIVVFKIDAVTGALKATGAKVEVGAPVCVVFGVRPEGNPRMDTNLHE